MQEIISNKIKTTKNNKKKEKREGLRTYITISGSEYMH